MRIVMLLLFCFANVITYAKVSRDSLWQVWNNPKQADTARLKAMGVMINNFYQRTKPDSALLLNDLQYKLAQKLKNDKALSDAIHIRGRIYANRSQHAKALESYEECLAIKKRIKDTVGITSCMNNMGLIYMDQGLNEKAITLFFDCLKIREKTKDRKGQINVLGNIGSAYYTQSDFNNALHYQLRSLKIALELNDKRSLGLISNSIGLNYEAQNLDKQALPHFLKSIGYLQEAKDHVNLTKALHNMGVSYGKTNNMDSAMYYHKMSLDLRSRLGDSLGIAKSYYAMGLVFLMKDKTQEAINYGEKALKIESRWNVYRVRKDISSFLYKAYESAGDYKKAYEMHKYYKATLDSLGKEDMKNVLFKEQLKYDFEKKEILEKAAHDAEMASFRLDTERADFRKNAMLIALGGTLLLLLVTGIFMVGRYRQKNIIVIQKANLLKQKLLVAQINPHFIFNSLNAIQNVIFSKSSLEAGTYLARFSELMRMILNFSRQDFIPVASEVKFLTEYLDLQQLRFSNKFNYSIVIDPEIDQDETLIPPMLAQPFVENAIEHGFAGKTETGNIVIRLFYKNNQLCYEIDDNGIGLEGAQKNKAGQQTKHESLATVITRERMEVLGNQKEKKDINIVDKIKQTKEGTGVLVNFFIPFKHA